MKPKKPVIWQGSNISNCDLCNQKIQETFVDGKTRMGPWGILCLECHKHYGLGLGIGKGQLYGRIEKGNDWIWIKISG